MIQHKLGLFEIFNSISKSQQKEPEIKWPLEFKPALDNSVKFKTLEDLIVIANFYLV